MRGSLGGAWVLSYRINFLLGGGRFLGQDYRIFRIYRRGFDGGMLE